MRHFDTQRGYLSMIAVIIILIVGFIGAMAGGLFSGAMLSTADHLASTQAKYLAESALERGTRELLTPLLITGNATTRTNNCSALNTTSITDSSTLSTGTYVVSSSGAINANGSSNYGGLTNLLTLNGALTAAATTIPFTGTATDYAANGGRIMIDQEEMNYGAISGTSFIGVVRGVDSTTAVAHVTGTPIGQNQCLLKGEGDVPSTTSPHGKRVLNSEVQLQEGWAVGANSGGAVLVMRWNGVSWTRFTTAGLPNVALNGVAVLSYADAWFVGAASGGELTVRWNGNTWTRSAVGTPNITFDGVFCNLTNDCWAVGAASGGNLGISHWNGSAWATSGGLPAPAINTVSNSVFCTSTSNCWLAGNNAGGAVLVQWNGASWTRNAGTAAAVAYRSVFCNSASDCWAVGAANGGNVNIARWNGTSWATSSGLPSPVINVQLNGVACTSTTNCWAVGNVSGTAVLLLWNGTNWTRTIGSAPAQNYLAVDCYNSNDCWAVGAAGTFVHWNGTTWAQITTTAPAVNINSVILVGPNSQPRSAWSENFP